MEKIKNSIKNILKITDKREMRILPGQLAFFMVLSLVPTITLLIFVFTNFSISLDVVVNFIEETFPREISKLITPSISYSGSFMNIILFMIMGFIIASNGPHSIIVASNVLYKIDGGNFIKRRTKAIFMTILLILLFLFTTVILAFGSYILRIILDFNIIRNFNQELYQIIELTKWPISMMFMFFIIKLLYTIAPDSTIPSRFMNKGAAFTTFGWALVTSIYSQYIGNVANYGIFYGGLSNLVILMIWIYILAYIFVLGIAINTNHYNESIKQD